MKEAHKHFYKDMIKALQNGQLALFAGAGLSVGAGYVNWKELLREIADEIGLNITVENDLISIAQYHINHMGGRSKINHKILQEFSDRGEYSKAHQILTRLPINTYWTTNYDKLLEKGLIEARRIFDTKYSVDQLHYSKPKRDAVIFKMHGDIDHASNAIITKDDYEKYHISHQPFITALSSDLISKTFLFIGFSFTDPNLDYVLSRIRIYTNGNQRHHYYFIKKPAIGDIGINDKAEMEYALRKHQLFMQDLKRFQLIPVEIDSYAEIATILEEIEFLFKKQTIFISGSAQTFGSWVKEDAQAFIHNLTKRLISEGYRVVNGFGWGVGSAVINGALEQIYSNSGKHSMEQLILRPFPQYSTGSTPLHELWHEYRHNMITYAGIAIYLFGNKEDPKNPGNIIHADGLFKEYNIGNEKGVIHIPVRATGFVAEEIAVKLQDENYGPLAGSKYAAEMGTLYDLTNADEIINQLTTIIKLLNQ